MIRVCGLSRWPTSLFLVVGLTLCLSVGFFNQALIAACGPGCSGQFCVTSSTQAYAYQDACYDIWQTDFPNNQVGNGTATIDYALATTDNVVCPYKNGQFGVAGCGNTGGFDYDEDCYASCVAGGG
jgi:hypothetical protein